MNLDDVATWQILFLAMALIAFVLAMLAEPVSRGYDRVQKWEAARRHGKKRRMKRGRRK